MSLMLMLTQHILLLHIKRLQLDKGGFYYEKVKHICSYYQTILNKESVWNWKNMNGVWCRSDTLDITGSCLMSLYISFPLVYFDIMSLSPSFVFIISLFYLFPLQLPVFSHPSTTLPLFLWLSFLCLISFHSLFPPSPIITHDNIKAPYVISGWIKSISVASPQCLVSHPGAELP